jgi:hypothetical protein
LAASAALSAQAEGTQNPLNAPAWHGLKGRLSLGTTPYRMDSGDFDSAPQRISSLSVMGDYYLTRPLLGASGGLRATSGLLLGPRASLWSSPASVDRRPGSAANPDGSMESASTAPYLGLGYTGLFGKGGWGVSADLGLMATSRSGVRLGKVFNGTQSLDDTMRDLRFLPLVQFGLSYSF